MEIHFEGQHTHRDIRKVVWRRFGWMYKVFALAISFSALYNVAIVIRAITARPSESLVQLITALPVLLLVAFAVLLWSLPWLMARRVTKLPVVQGTATEEALALTLDHVEGTTRWEFYQYYKLWDDMVVLYITQSDMTALPRSFFASNDDWQQLRQFIQDTVPAKPARRVPFLLRWPGILLISFILFIIIFVLAYFSVGTP